MKIQIKIVIILLILITLIVLVRATPMYNIFLKQIYPIKYSEYVEKYSKEYNVDPLLIYSVIKAESNFNAKAMSISGAKGLMQIIDSTASEIKTNIIDKEKVNNKDLKEPEYNIMIGTKYYSYLVEQYHGNMLLALSAYNAGIGNVNSWIATGIIKPDGSDIENIPFKETNMYVRKIVNNYKIYQKLYQKK